MHVLKSQIPCKCWPFLHCTWFNRAYPFLLQSPAWLWAINTCTLRGGSIIFTGSKPWSEMKKIRYTILLDIYSCCNPIYLNIYRSYRGFSGNNSFSNLYLLPEHLILSIQTASYNLPYKHGVLKKKPVLKIKILRYLYRNWKFKKSKWMMIVMREKWNL